MLQAAQVRKAAFVPEDGVRYNPDQHQSCSVYAGTTVQQVRTLPPLSPLSTHLDAFACVVPEDGVGCNQSCSVYAGTTVQQVGPPPLAPLPLPLPPRLPPLLYTPPSLPLPRILVRLLVLCLLFGFCRGTSSKHKPSQKSGKYTKQMNKLINDHTSE